MTTEEDARSSTAQINHAGEVCSKQVEKFVSYLHAFDPELNAHEVILVAAAVFNELPGAFSNDPEMLSSLKAECQFIKEHRQK